MTTRDEKYLEKEIAAVLTAFAGKYAQPILNSKNSLGETFLQSTINNLIELTEYGCYGCYNDDDIKLAISKTISERLGIDT